jgi:hypothetical protein
MLGAGQAGAAGPTRILKFINGSTNFVGLGFNANSNAIPPVGSRFAITLRIKNDGAQFGKPSGAIVGRVLIECTVLAEPTPQGLDGNCIGIAHVPDGFFTFEGRGGLSNAKVNYWAITGGVGPYANVRGELKTGGNHAVVTLYS